MTSPTQQYESTVRLMVEAQQGWLRLTFNEPEKKNRLSDELVADLLVILGKLSTDRTVRGVSFRGRGGFFCAGGDLSKFAKMMSASRAEVVQLNEQGGALFEAIRSLPQVTVALLEGAALAGGLGIACCCDVVIATRETRFAFSETQLGIIPAQIAPYVIQRVGLAIGRRLMVTAEQLTADDALNVQLVDDVVDTADQLAERELAVMARVLRCAPGAVASLKKLLSGMNQLGDQDATHVAALHFADCLLSEEGREGLASFHEKRKPYWAVEI